MLARSNQLRLFLLAFATGLSESFGKPKRHLRAAVVEDLRSGQDVGRGNRSVGWYRDFTEGSTTAPRRVIPSPAMKSGGFLLHIVDQMGERRLVKIM
jgi:hypothetical protein